MHMRWFSSFCMFFSLASFWLWKCCLLDVASSVGWALASGRRISYPAWGAISVFAVCFLVAYSCMNPVKTSTKDRLGWGIRSSCDCSLLFLCVSFLCLVSLKSSLIFLASSCAVCLNSFHLVACVSLSLFLVCFIFVVTSMFPRGFVFLHQWFLCNV